MVDARLLKARAGQDNAKVPLRRNTGVDLTSPFEPKEEDVAVFDSFKAGVTNTGIVTGALRAGAEALENGFNHTPVEGYRPLDHVQQDDTINKRVQPILDQAGSGHLDSVIDRLRSAQSPQEFEAVLGQYEERDREIKAMAANPIAAIGGALTGIVPDILLGVLTGGAGTAGTVTAGSAGAARGIAMLRLGLLGAAEGVAERGMQQLTNPMITPGDIAAGGAMGAGAGGILGAIAPKAFGNVVASPRNMDEMISQVEGLTGRSIGAAAANEVPLDTPAPFAQGVGIAKNLGASEPMRAILRSPKRIAVDFGVKGKEQARAGLSGNLTIFNQINRLVRLGTTTDADVAAVSGRATTAQDYRDAVQTTHIVHEKQARELYVEMQNEVFGANKLETNLRDNAVATFGKKGLTQEEFEGIADEFAQARGAGTELDFASFVSGDIADRVSTVDMEALEAMVTKKADMDDAFYHALGKQEVELGLIREDELIPGYRPQVWNKSAIEADPEEFDRFITEVFAKTPDDEWLADSGFIQPGETWKTLVNRDPNAADDAMGFWENAVKGQLVAKKEQAVAKAKARVAAARRQGLSDTNDAAKLERIKKLETSQSTAEAELAKARLRLDKASTPEAVARAEKQIATHSTRLDKIAADIERATEGDLANSMRSAAVQAQKTIDEQATLLSRITNEHMRQRVSTRIAKAERRLAQAEDGLKRMQDDTVTVSNYYDDLIASFGKRAHRKALKKAEAAAVRAEAAVQKVIDAPDIGEQARLIRSKLLANKDPFGLPDADAVGTSSRFKNRALHLGRHRSTPSARKFLRRSGVDNRGAYVSSVAPRIALQRTFGGVDGQAVNTKTILDQIDGAFDLDRAKASSSDHADLLKDQRNGKALVEGMLGEFTGANRSKYAGTSSDLASLAGSATSMMLLNSVVISQLADLVVMAAAGGRLSTGLKSLVSFGKNKKFVKELEAMGEDEVAMIVRGPEVFSGSRTAAINDIDVEDLNVPGSKLRDVARWTNNAATLNGWVSFMHQMNRHFRGSFGADMARQIGVDVGKFKELSPSLRTFYARLGIGEIEADAMAAMLKKHHHDVQGAKLPNSAKWAEEDPELLALYKSAMKAAGDEAMLSPSVGDRPFLSASPGGRVLLQFQSFTFTMADRFLAPLIQRGRLGGPEEAGRTFGIVVAGIGMGGIVGMLKAAKAGRLEEWSNQSERDHMYEAFLRGPLMTGPSSTLVEVGSNMFGKAANDGVEALLGVRPIKERPTRFRDQAPFAPLLGPGLSTVNRIGSSVSQIAEGDVQGGLDKISKMTPVISAFYVQAVTNAMNEE